ncbi:thiolase domain-containing protein [Streptantibioticus rubrisoli]|uniref:Thiolase domain-containing protein n=1 Tax=Streptantibioticus rubrisoli TaxID=1387313 RepID=A0ABT1P995_9ACTN|nr:thiolase domain-containing protein [Streptantibioticus rubrisoli]MCQ4041936.1 thiolase domain-containing protein [Streptantibioticus rubrisoli]
MTRDVAIVAFGQSEHLRDSSQLSEVEMLMPVLHQVLGQVGLTTDQIDFTCSGSSDYLAGRAFSFTMALDGVGAWPPIAESHVEMDGAWALYEAWVKILTGEAETALVYAYGKSSAGELRDVLTRQLDPYYVAPLWPDSVSLAALQAQSLIDAGLTDERQLADIATRYGAHDDAYAVRPLRRQDCPPISDGAAAVVLAAGDTARGLCPRPAWIRGMDHRIEAHSLGVRDLADSPSTRLAAECAGAFDAPVDTAELHAPFSSQEALLRRVLDLDDSVQVNPSGGALVANPVMATGLIRLGEAAARIHRGQSGRALAHATSGPCLQQNLVAVLEAS